MNTNHRVAGVAVLLLAACAKPAVQPPADVPAAANASAGSPAAGGVKLSAEEIQKIGIEVMTAGAVQVRDETEGFGVVLGHEAIAQLVADAAAAGAAARQSAAALARSRRLSGTAGADSAEAQEIAQRQAATDQAAQQLANRKLSALLGQRPPWPDAQNARIVDEIATGRRKLLKATFPLGARLGEVPPSLRVARLDAARAEDQWSAHPVWPAPSDASVPGRSFHALLSEPELAEGERLRVWSPAEHGAAGAFVPAAAAVISQGRYWVYREQAPGTYVRVALDISHPLRDGYVAADGIKPGDRVVRAGAGLLLAREMNSGSAAE